LSMVFTARQRDLDVDEATEEAVVRACKNWQISLGLFYDLWHKRLGL